ncbi:MAG: glutathione S-transferase family protein [Gammaproteobacteria bacterium]
MITLYKFGPIGDVCDASPFCVKVEAYLRMANLPYETRSGALYLRKAPKRKLPYIDDDGKIVADSGFILNHLKAAHGDTLDSGLSVEEKAIAHSFIRMIEENLYWVLVHARWTLDNNRPVLKKTFFSGIPAPIDHFIASMARRDVVNALYKHGMGRHSDEEIVEIGSRDLHALSDFLGAKPYFLGDRPTTLDAVAYGMLVELIRVPLFSAPIFDRARSYSNLVEFTDRFHEAYFTTPGPQNTPDS